MTSRRGVIVSAIAAALVSIALIAPAVAADPTTISVSPKEQFSNGCNPSASWTIGLSGGLSGQFHTTGHGSMEGGRFAIENVSHPDWVYDDFTPTHFTATATVNPEPVTMLLMATGLAGIGGALRRRKRNRS